MAELSYLEKLPTEILQEVAILGKNIHLLHASPILRSKLNCDYVKKALVEEAFFAKTFSSEAFHLDFGTRERISHHCPIDVASELSAHLQHGLLLEEECSPRFLKQCSTNAVRNLVKATYEAVFKGISILSDQELASMVQSIASGIQLDMHEKSEKGEECGEPFDSDDKCHTRMRIRVGLDHRRNLKRVFIVAKVPDQLAPLGRRYDFWNLYLFCVHPDLQIPSKLFQFPSNDRKISMLESIADECTRGQFLEPMRTGNMKRSRTAIGEGLERAIKGNRREMIYLLIDNSALYRGLPSLGYYPEPYHFRTVLQTAKGHGDEQADLFHQFLRVTTTPSFLITVGKSKKEWRSEVKAGIRKQRLRELLRFEMSGPSFYAARYLREELD